MTSPTTTCHGTPAFVACICREIIHRLSVGGKSGSALTHSFLQVYIFMSKVEFQVSSGGLVVKSMLANGP